MATTWKELVRGLGLTNTSALLYTAPAGTYTAIHAASVNNPTAGVINVNLFIVPVGQSVGNAYKVSSKSVLAGATGQFPEIVNHKLEPGAMIYGDGNGCFMTISGAENVPNV